jgi:excisionase family DNA binding protein
LSNRNDIVVGYSGGFSAMDKKLTVSEAAERAGISESLIYQLCEERRLVHFRIGKKGAAGEDRYSSTPATFDAFGRTRGMEWMLHLLRTA